MILCQLTDLHVRPRGKLSNSVVDTNRLTEQAFRAVAQFTPRPDAVLITGDLTECGLAEEYALLAELLRLLPMPVFVIPGNHDRREILERALGHLPGVASDPRFVQYAVWRFRAESGLDECNGRQIDDRGRCDRRQCPVYRLCDRVALKPLKGVQDD